jgi:hypothetical protein
MLIDFYAHGGAEWDHPAKHTVAHHGFTEKEMRGIFETAGAGGEFGMSDIGSMTFTKVVGEDKTVTEMKRRLFIARGTKV